MVPSTDSSDSAAPEPNTIGPEQHPITLDLIDNDALFVLKKLNNAGYSSYLVGGGVRDLYLNNPPKDFDICTEARPGQIRKLFPNSKTIGRRFRLVQLFFKQGKIIEVATLRSLSEHDLDGPEAVLAPNNTYGTLDQDAQRRDLTINSLFFEIENCTIIDYVGGVDDLDQSLIRFVGDPVKRIKRDPVRMLRAIRHSARNNFTIESKSWQAICDHHHNLPLCPASRLRDELLKDLYGGVAQYWFPLATQSGLFLELFPIYQQVFHQTLDNDNRVEEQLTKLLMVIDRANHYFVSHQLSRPKDFFLLALLLLPWAQKVHNLMEVPLKGPDRFHLSTKIREDIDQEIAQHLNLRKSLRQEIITLLINLPFLIYHKRRGFWPKWLKKKSYFQKCSLFYSYYQEAYLDKPIPDSVFDSKAAKKTAGRPPSRRRPRNRKRGHSSSSGKKVNVFGLKK